jgi:hypothetical protein
LKTSNNRPGPKPPAPPVPTKPSFTVTTLLNGQNVSATIARGRVISLPAGASANLVVKVRSRKATSFDRFIRTQILARSEVNPAIAASAQATIVLEGSR